MLKTNCIEKIIITFSHNISSIVVASLGYTLPADWFSESKTLVCESVPAFCNSTGASLFGRRRIGPSYRLNKLHCKLGTSKLFVHL